MLKEFKHYGVTVFYQVVEGQTFKQALRKAGIDYVDLPIMLPVGAEAIRYEKDGAARYACTKMEMIARWSISLTGYRMTWTLFASCLILTGSGVETSRSA